MNSTVIEESKVKRLPPRKDVPESDTWDLSKLFPDDDAWEESFKRWESMVGGFEKFRGRLSEDAATLADCLSYDSQVDRAFSAMGLLAPAKGQAQEVKPGGTGGD